MAIILLNLNFMLCFTNSSVMGNNFCNQPFFAFYFSIQEISRGFYSARLSLSLSLSPLYPFHLSIPFTSLSLSPLYPFHLSIHFTSLLSLPPSLYLSFYLSFSLSPSLSLLSIIIFGVSNGRFRPCYILINIRCMLIKNNITNHVFLYFLLQNEKYASEVSVQVFLIIISFNFLIYIYIKY